MFSHFLLCNLAILFARYCKCGAYLVFAPRFGCIYHFHGEALNIGSIWVHTIFKLISNVPSVLVARALLHSTTLSNIIIKIQPTDRNSQR